MEYETVRIDSGLLRGRRKNDVIEFRGVPYAAAPVGEARFGPPRAVNPWSGVYAAISDGPIAPQPAARASYFLGDINGEQSEDCLTLTLWAPARQREKLPVMLWLHGGGFATGAGSLPCYDGANLSALGNLIVVNANYRLGALGFLCIPDSLDGNLAILDQLAALKWLHVNACAFGGDPDNITVVGQSGGAHNIVSLLLIEETQGLIRRAILQSPPLGVGLQSAKEASRCAEVFLDAMTLRPGAGNLVSALREAPLERIMAAQGTTARKLSGLDRGDLRTAFAPSSYSPHSSLQDSVGAAAAEAAAKRGVEIMIGWTRDEAKLFYPPGSLLRSVSEAQLVALSEDLAGDDAAELLVEARRHRRSQDPGELLLDIISNFFFRTPALRMAQHIAANGGVVHVYQFDWTSHHAHLGSCHCLDLPFTSGNLETWAATPLLHGADRAAIAGLSRSMMECWVAFARRGDAGFSPWSEHSRPVMHFNIDSHAEE